MPSHEELTRSLAEFENEYRVWREHFLSDDGKIDSEEEEQLGRIEKVIGEIRYQLTLDNPNASLPDLEAQADGVGASSQSADPYSEAGGMSQSPLDPSELVSVAPPEPFDLELTILDKNGAAIGRAKVLVSDVDTGYTDVNGSVFFSGLPSGTELTVQVLVSDESFSEVITGQPSSSMVETIQTDFASDVVVPVDDPSFWQNLQDYAHAALNTWLTQVRGAAATFRDELTKDESTPTDEVAWGAMKKALGKVPASVDFGVSAALVKVGDVSLWLAKKLGGGKQSLPDFLAKLEENLNGAAMLIRGREGEPFDALRKLANSAKKDDPDFRADVENGLRRAVSQMPTREAILQALAVDWASGGDDGWDNDWVGDGNPKSGYIFVEVLYRPDRKKFSLLQPPYIDDVSLPNNTNDVLTRAFSGHTPLDALPIPINLKVHYILIHRDDDEDREKSKKVVYSFYKPAGGSYGAVGDYNSGWSLGESLTQDPPSPDDVIAEWNQKGVNSLKISDLKDESLLWATLASRMAK